MENINLSKFFLIEDESVVSYEEKLKISLLNYQMPFVISKGSTTNKFPYYSHTFIHRPTDDASKSSPNICSNYFYFYYTLLKKFCGKYNIKYSSLSRANINSTYFFPNYEYLDPHIDHYKEHLVVLMYLNEVDTTNERYNSTVIFDKKIDYQSQNPIFCYDLSHQEQKIPIKCEIKPKLGKIICFNGAYYHSNRFPKPGENRIACVFNLLI